MFFNLVLLGCTVVGFHTRQASHALGFTRVTTTLVFSMRFVFAPCSCLTTLWPINFISKCLNLLFRRLKTFLFIVSYTQWWRSRSALRVRNLSIPRVKLSPVSQYTKGRIFKFNYYCTVPGNEHILYVEIVKFAKIAL